MADTRKLERVDTGVPGLDTILNGGLLSGGVYVVEGSPGSGKTILGNQICFHRASRGDSTIYITLLAESHTRLISHLRTMTFFRPELISSSIYYVSAFKVLEQAGLDGLLKSVQESVHARKASFVVLDGLVSAEEFAPSPSSFKKFIHELQTISGMTGCTVLLLSSTERKAPFRSEHTMVDGLIELGDTMVGVQSLRYVQVRKMRGTRQLRGRHALEISSAGILIRPRIETLLHGPEEDDPAPRPVEQADFGVIGLDAMLRGGLPGGSNTLVLGPSGSGKTMLGLQFLSAGARHERVGLYVGFYERPFSLLAKGARLGLGLEAAREAGLLHLFWEAPIEGVLDAVVERVLRAVAEHGVKRLCFDGLHGFRHHAEYPDRTRAVFSALADELTRRGVTTLFTLEIPGLVGASIEVPIDGVSSLADNLILLRHVEIRSQLYRLISILKVRDRPYDGSIREFQITDRGVHVADTFDTAEQILTGAARVIVEPAPSVERLRMSQSVLIVDDEFGLADITADLLTEAGYDVALAINGKLGLASLAVRHADIVLTDLMMPVMDGPEMIRRMRADKELAAIPTILMTALPEAIPTGPAALHDAVLVKPYSMAELLETIRRLLPPR